MAASKPSFHLSASNGWMNDPCGLGYDPLTGLYHMSFQWNPSDNDWGNISWGHATSTDLVSWRVSSTPALTPSTEYDRCGVFTGCLQATDPGGNPGALTAIYTSVKHLPLHYTLPYTFGCESLSLAVSKNGGRTWERPDCNPILDGPPEHLSVTGWRDPHLTTWPAAQQTNPVGQGQDQVKKPANGIVAGGVVGRTPAIFVYQVNPKDLRQWTYTGLLVDIGLNFHPSRWSGDFGVNWEVSNLVTLTNDAGDYREFAIMGAEGCLRANNSLWTTHGSAQHKRQPRSQLWMCINRRAEIGHDEVLANYQFGGHFDHGCLYAANSFWDPVTSRRVVYGWITEEDLPDEARHRQGWSGVISIPRVVELRTIRGVVKARSSELSSISSVELVPDERPSAGPRTYTIHTLGIKPDPRMTLIRKEAAKVSDTLVHRLPTALGNSSSESLALKSSRWEIKAEFKVNASCDRVGIEIGHLSDHTLKTTLCWAPSSETFTIHRPTLKDQTINHGYESAPHTLFSFKNNSYDRNRNRNEIDDRSKHNTQDSKTDICTESQHKEKDTAEVEETLQIHAFYDSSVLEVFVNDRTVISTRLYTHHSHLSLSQSQPQPQPQPQTDSQAFPSEQDHGLRFFAESTVEDECPPAVLLKADIWDGLAETIRFLI
ncbi:hypothetical protein N7539_003192 [Penicillium diatomitis]|uniref:Uncharacterized protein n=1 Tax=Penicillium diatomitis TaxID=2819901 RepID=A0A9W9XG34_9EURO|nr:uncharacterized protein N7539_003192 [Penicillium diatomitis]KAJ5491625.1 hypothetical protein N7539_003192 [Penicillium diatomitis]